jgi:hypothetical protein
MIEGPLAVDSTQTVVIVPLTTTYSISSLGEEHPEVHEKSKIAFQEYNRF